MFDHDFFENINTEAKAYFLGLITADGSIVHDKSGVRSPMISIELIDLDILEKLKEVTKTSSEMSVIDREGRNLTYTWSIRSKKMAEDLKELGIEQDKTNLMMSINTNIKEDLKRHYIRGLVDGDGSIYYSLGKYHVSYTTKHKDFADSIQKAFMDLTGKENIKKITCYNGVHKITYDGKDAVNLCNILYSNSNYSIKRKRVLAETARLAGLLDD